MVDCVKTSKNKVMPSVLFHEIWGFSPQIKCLTSISYVAEVSAAFSMLTSLSWPWPRPEGSHKTMISWIQLPREVSSPWGVLFKVLWGGAGGLCRTLLRGDRRTTTRHWLKSDEVWMNVGFILIHAHFLYLNEMTENWLIQVSADGKYLRTNVGRILKGQGEV